MKPEFALLPSDFYVLERSMRRAGHRAERNRVPAGTRWLRIRKVLALHAAAGLIGIGGALLTLPLRQQDIKVLIGPAPALAESTQNSAGVPFSDAPWLSPTAIEPLGRREAMARNLEIPISSGTVPGGMRLAPGNDAVTFKRALDCMTAAVYYEAGDEPVEGKRAVAQVIINRVRHPAFPSTVCGVVFQGATRETGCQFSFTCNGALQKRPVLAAWLSARAVAQSALEGWVDPQVGLSTHYHADYVVPYWASSLAKNVVIGRHIFYSWRGSLGQPAAFVQAYASREPVTDIWQSHSSRSAQASIALDPDVFNASGEGSQPAEGQSAPLHFPAPSITTRNAQRYAIAMDGERVSADAEGRVLQ